MTKKAMQSEEMFDSLVANAIDFLRHSIDELEKKPKYSVIHFCAAIELFLKARLMREHWSLIDEEPQKANITKFLNGDFKSVGIDGTIYRLQNIVGVRTSKEARRSFSELREHRNKMVHFFHRDYGTQPAAETIQKIVIEQSKGWFHLHRLISRDWKTEFAKYLEEVEELHRLMRNQRGYLQAKFESLLPDIEKGKQRGIVFSACDSCGFEASTEKAVIANLFRTDCLVCEIHSRMLRETCPQCGGRVDIYDLVEGYRDDCDKQLDLAYFVGKYAPPEYFGEGMYGENRAYCADCEYTDQMSVVPFGDEWLCLACLNLHDRIEQCGWCRADVAGDMEGSFVSGCMFCDGLAGHSD